MQRWEEDEDEPQPGDACALCNGPLVSLGRLGCLEHLRCRNCGHEQSEVVVEEADQHVRCDCSHEPEHHDPVSGACFYANPTHGPCPCAATPPATRAALEAAHRTLKRVLAEQRR